MKQMNDDTFENLEIWKEAVKLLKDADAPALIADAKRLSKRIARLMEVRRKDFN